MSFCSLFAHFSTLKFNLLVEFTEDGDYRANRVFNGFFSQTSVKLDFCAFQKSTVEIEAFNSISNQEPTQRQKWIEKRQDTLYEKYWTLKRSRAYINYVIIFIILFPYVVRRTKVLQPSKGSALTVHHHFMPCCNKVFIKTFLIN